MHREMSFLEFGVAYDRVRLALRDPPNMVTADPPP